MTPSIGVVRLTIISKFDGRPSLLSGALPASRNTSVNPVSQKVVGEHLQLAIFTALKVSSTFGPLWISIRFARADHDVEYTGSGVESIP